jgi:predicted Zn-dependent protease with MMP-like domain
VPLARTRPERFDDLVLDAVERVERAIKDDADLAARLAVVEYGVEEVPPEDVIAATEAGTEPLPLARVEEASSGSPPRVVIYRRPIELRAPDPRVREGVVHEVVVERLAELLGVTVDELDPPYPD